MKINEVETLVNITKKNIRFYEEQGLIAPRRNLENGYRDYCEEDVQRLQQIKLLRKLGVSIEEIRQMLNGNHTVGDGMRRHLITLERERQNLDQSITFCRNLQNMNMPLGSLDASEVLREMEEMEKGGTTFQNKQKNDVRIGYIAPVIVTIITTIFMGAMIYLLWWAYQVEPEEAPPALFILVFVLMFLAVIGGVILALIQRIREIRKGEMEDAGKY